MANAAEIFKSPTKEQWEQMTTAEKIEVIKSGNASLGREFWHAFTYAPSKALLTKS